MMTIIQAKSENDLTLGRQGENLARQVVFDLSAWEAEYGPGVAELIHQRPGDASPYPVAAVREGSTLVWTVSNLDTAVAATVNSPAHCELRWYVGDVLAKSRTWTVYVSPAMDTPTETAPPEPEQGWVEQVLATGAEAKNAANRAEEAAKRAEEAGGGVNFTTDETLSLKDGVLSVNTAQEPDPDNTLPITSAAVHTTVGNIEILLKTI